MQIIELDKEQLKELIKESVRIALEENQNKINGQSPAQAEEKLLTIQEASEFLKLSVATIYSKVSKGELPVMKRSKRLYFSNKELLEYLKDGRINKI